MNRWSMDAWNMTVRPGNGRRRSAMPACNARLSVIWRSIWSEREDVPISLQIDEDQRRTKSLPLRSFYRFDSMKQQI